VTTFAFVETFGLPETALSNLKVPKTTFIKGADLVGADKKLVTSGLKDLRVVASVTDAIAGTSPAGTVAAEMRDELAVAEILFVEAELASAIKESETRRMEELLHRSIPNPVILHTFNTTTSRLSLAIKRQSESDSSKQTIVRFYAIQEMAISFPAALTFPSQSYFSLGELYESWFSQFYGMWLHKALGLTMEEPIRVTFAQSREAYDTVKVLSDELEVLVNAAKAEKQINRRVELNKKIRDHRAILEIQKAKFA
jgi:hypothetical protein